jgi:outer membrane protein OmpA-like peptidoglycan-associated protein
MQTHSSLQRRTNSESSDRFVNSIPPDRPWSDPLYEQPAQSQTPHPGYDLSNIDLFSHDPGPRSYSQATLGTSSPAVQAKLTVGAPNDHYEQEADRVAEQVMSTPDSAIQQPIQRDMAPTEEEEPLQAKPLATTITPWVQRDMAPEEDEPLQAKHIQRDMAPEEDEPLQAKRIQRDMASEEEEEPLQAKRIQRDMAPEEEEAIQTKGASNASFHAGKNLESQISSSQGGGSPLSDEVRRFMEPRFGTDFSQVRVHTGNESIQMNQDLNAQAFTHHQDVYFGAGKAPGKDALTAHELTHVVQQTGGVRPKTIQRAIGPTHDLTHGTFNVTATPQDATAGGPNVPITIGFTPKTTAPISNQIGLIQIVKLTNAGGTNVEPQSLPAARGASLRTQTTDGTGVDAGYFTDVLHNPTATGALPAGGANQGDALAPQYVFGNGPAQQPNPATPGLSRPDSKSLSGSIIGFKRSDDPGDIKAAELTDAPGGNGEFDFAFETVAKGEDTNTIYGAMKWSFQIRGGKVQGDTSSAVDGQSTTFDAALERHRDFYVHEPVVFYFDFDRDTLGPAEIAKIATFKAYLARFAAPTPTNPKIARVSPQGFADQRGNAAHNQDLSLRRAEAVRAALLAEGIPEAQIDPISIGAGASSGFTADATTDQDQDANRQFNRRVVLTFEQVTP